MSNQVEVLIARFDDTSTAQQAVDSLTQLEKGGVLEVHDLARIVKHEDGKVEIKDEDNVTGKRGAIFGAIAGGLLGLIGGPVGMILGATAGAATGGVTANLVNMGFPKEDLQVVVDNTPAGSSAILAVVGGADVSVALTALRDLGGDVRFHEMPEELRQQVEYLRTQPMLGAQPLISGQTTPDSRPRD
ncbi:DUF1269 domain-containing protein [Candidatus Gracilibacteria bacterium]|nr:DUF1269 domain-containing protein [Candidatus Gracilibacteria bacterium]